MNGSSNDRKREAVYLHPPRDRRRGRRLLTLRNARWLFVAIVGFFITISLVSELRPRGEGEFGRLYERRPLMVEDLEVKAPTPAVETEIRDQISADPMLLETQRKQQMLEAPPLAAPAEWRASAEPVRGAPLAAHSTRGTSRFRISGGPDGVVLEQK